MFAIKSEHTTLESRHWIIIHPCVIGSEPFFSLLLGVSSDYAQPITFSILPCEWPSIAWAYPGQDTKNGPSWLVTLLWQHMPSTADAPHNRRSQDRKQSIAWHGLYSVSVRSFSSNTDHQPHISNESVCTIKKNDTQCNKTKQEVLSY